jgi:hypothetical protein
MKKLIILYQYLFYRIYVEWKKQTKENDAAISAMFALSGLIGYNLVFIFNYVDIFIGESLFSDNIQIVSMGILLFLINTFIFLYKKKYIIIENQFKNETKRQKIWSKIAIFSLIGITLVQIIIMIISKQ